MEIGVVKIKGTAQHIEWAARLKALGPDFLVGLTLGALHDILQADEGLIELAITGFEQRQRARTAAGGAAPD